MPEEKKEGVSVVAEGKKRGGKKTRKSKKKSQPSDSRGLAGRHSS